MSKNDMNQKQSIVPYLFCENIEENLDFLTNTFGMKPIQIQYRPDGKIKHAEIGLGHSIVMMGQASSDWGTTSPRHLPAIHSGILVYVEDVDAHFQQAHAKGATIISPLQNMSYGDRMYAAKDCEGNQWYFATTQLGEP